MPTATVLVQGKSEPERGKKRGRIKSDSGMVFQADPILLRQVSVGHTYEFDYRDDSFARDDGEVIKFRVVEKVRGSGDGDGSILAKPAAPLEGKVASYDYKGEEIACLAIAKIEGEIDSDSVFERLKAAALGLRRFRAWQKSPASEMNDDIPY